jgi:hypothetical protein
MVGIDVLDVVVIAMLRQHASLRSRGNAQSQSPQSIERPAIVEYPLHRLLWLKHEAEEPSDCAQGNDDDGDG